MANNPACKSFIPQLSAFIDGELSPDERQSVERHLTACKDCTARVADLRAESGLVRIGLEMAADEVDWSGFSQKVMARITPEKPPMFERIKASFSEMFLYQRGTLVSGFAVAAAVAVVATTLLLREPPSTAGYAQDQMAVDTVKTHPSAHVAPVVMESDQGSSIIWLVDHPATNDLDRGFEAHEELEMDPDIGASPSHKPDGGTKLDPNEGGQL
jgi:anti-sigma factor RsiW